MVVNHSQRLPPHRHIFPLNKTVTLKKLLCRHTQVDIVSFSTSPALSVSGSLVVVVVDSVLFGELGQLGVVQIFKSQGVDLQAGVGRRIIAPQGGLRQTGGPRQEYRVVGIVWR